MSLSVANGAASLPIAWRLYLPQAWAEDAELRRKVKIPAQIALEQIRTAKIQGIAPGVVLADAGYGADGGFRTGLTDLDLTYVLGRSRRSASGGQARASCRPNLGAARGVLRLGASAPMITSDLGPAAPPIRSERRVPTSIATIRRRLTVALANRL